VIVAAIVVVVVVEPLSVVVHVYGNAPVIVIDPVQRLRKMFGPLDHVHGPFTFTCRATLAGAPTGTISMTI